MDILNTREWAILIWGLVVIGYLSISPKTEGIGKQFKSLLKTFFARPIVSVFMLMTIYVVLVVYVYSQIGFWEWHQFKNTIIWYFSIAAMSLVKVSSVEGSPNYLKDTVLNSVKLVGIIEFIVGFYTFNILIELILVPFLFVLGVMVALTQNDKKYKAADEFINGLLSVVGLIAIGFALYMMVTNVGELTTKETLYDFMVPPLLTLAYIPFMMFIVMYSAYENVFVRLPFFIKGSVLRFYAKLMTMIRFNFRSALLERWASSLAISDVSSMGDINRSISHIFKMVKAERNPPKVESSEGWSPYEAKDYLLSEGVITRQYHPVDEKEWWCGSNSLEFGEGLFKNNIAYYVSGDSRVAKCLKLLVNVNNPEESELASGKLISSAKLLMDKAVGVGFPPELEGHIHEGTGIVSEVSGVEIKFYKSVFLNHTFNGYRLGFEISRL